MDIQHLVDRLEALIDEGRHIFGTKYTIIDEERALEIIDQMRISIPEEIEKAARILAQRERILAEAHEEAARIVQQHRQKAEALIDQEATVQAAKARADAIKDQARAEATRITQEADEYVADLLGRLEEELVRDLNQVRIGLEHLRKTMRSALPANTNGTGIDAQPLFLPNQEMAEPVEVTLDYSDDTN